MGARTAIAEGPHTTATMAVDKSPSFKPYLGARLPGVVKVTYLDGERIYERRAVGASARGVLLTREPSER